MFRKYFPTLLVIALVVVGAVLIFKSTGTSDLKNFADNFSGATGATLSVKDKTIKLEIADTEEKQSIGLSGRKGLDIDTGMLFVFEKPEFWGFWMKDMLFPVDIIWLDANYKVVSIEGNAKPDSYPETFIPDEKSSYVLEVESGFAEKNEIVIGSTLNIKR